MYAHLRYLIAAPMHHSIIAAVHGVPCINLSYQKKCVEFYRMLGTRELGLNIHSLIASRDSGPVTAAMKMVENNYDAYVERFSRGIAKIQKKALRNFDYLDAMVEEYE